MAADHLVHIAEELVALRRVFPRTRITQALEARKAAARAACREVEERKLREIARRIQRSRKPDARRRIAR